MKIEILRGPQNLRKFRFETDSVLIGRDLGGVEANVDLAPDRAVSGRHAHIFRSQGSWWINDLGSTNGTMVNSVRLAPRIPRRLLFGEVVQAGTTLFVVGSDRLMLVQDGPVSAFLEPLPVYSCTLRNNRISVCSRIHLINTAARAEADVELAVAVPGHARTFRKRIGTIAPGEVHSIDPEESITDWEGLDSVTTEEEARIVVSLNGRREAEAAVTVVALADWPHLARTLTSLASFVQPGDNAIRQLEFDSVQFLAGPNPGAPLSGGASDDRRERTLRSVVAIYRSLADRHAIRYFAPQVRTARNGRFTYQQLRTPEQVLAGDDRTTGHADCLDLTLVLAACCEAMGLLPLIVLVGWDGIEPEHAFLGCWLDGAPRYRPVIEDRAALLAQIDAGRLLVVESTGACAGERRLGFDAARREARDKLRRGGSVLALDVTALRPPLGPISPVRLSQSPVVARIYRESVRLQRERGLERLETSHLLYGLLKTGGDLTSRLFERCDRSIEKSLVAVERAIPRDSLEGVGEPTTNYRRCQDEAIRNSVQRRGSMVREADLLWAVIHSPSAGLRALLGTIGADRETLVRELSRISTRPIVDSSPIRR